MKLLQIIILFIFIYKVSYCQTNNNDTIKIKQITISDKKNIKETSIIIQKIDSNIIAEETNNSLSELLSKYTPVFVKNYGKTSLSTVSIRGTATSHTDVLFNGISLKSPMLGQVDFSLIPNNLFNNISINYGGSSIINTSGALGGNINLYNKINWKNKLSGVFIQDIGSYTTINSFVAINTGIKNLQFSTKLYNNYSKNDFTFKNKNISTIDSLSGKYIYPYQKNKNAEFYQNGFFQSVNYKKNNITLSLNYWHQNTNRAIPRLNTYEGNDYSNINKQNDLSNNIFFKSTYYKNKSKINFYSAVINKQINYKLKNYISGNGYYNVINSYGVSNSLYNKINYEYKFSDNILISTNYSFNYHKVKTKEIIQNNGYNKIRKENNFYISLYNKTNNRLSNSIIIRQNLVDNKIIPIIPFFGIDYLISKNNDLHIKASVSKNYNIASLNDLYWQPGGNPNLKPEESRSADISLVLNKKTNKIFNILFSATYYYSYINNWIIWLPSPLGYWSPYNINKVKSQGIEINAKINYTINKIHIFANANYSYTSSINKGDSLIWKDAYNKQLPYIPKHSGNIFISIKYKKYYINYIHNSYSERYTSSSQEISRRDWLYPYFMNNLSFGKMFNIKNINIDLKFKIYNLFNEEYRTVLGRPMPRQNYLLQIKLKF